MRKVGCLLCLFALLSGCAQYGVRTTLNNSAWRTVGRAQAQSYASNHLNLTDTAALWTFDPPALDTLARSTFKPAYHLDYQPLLQFQVFNRAGRRVAHYATVEGRVRQVLAAVPPRNFSPPDVTTTLADELQRYRTWQGGALPANALPDADYVVIAWWTARGGAETERLFAALDRYLATPNGHTWVLRAVNTDFLTDADTDAAPPPPGYNPHPYR